MPVLETLIADVRAHAARFDNEWDRRAVDWPDLTPESVVVEVGGYTGRWALQIAERYQPRLYVFEPQFWAFEVCREVLGDRAEVLPYGLGVETGYFPVGAYGGDGASFLKTDGEQAVCQMLEIAAAFAQQDITHIDLMLMNIEGHEFTLIPHMFAQGIYPQRLMVQLHGSDAQTNALRALLAQSYAPLWDYGYVLSAWRLL